MRKRVIIPLVSTAVFYILLYLCSGRLHFFTSSGNRLIFAPLGFNLIFDFMLQMGIGYVLFSFSRRTYLFIIEQGILMAVVFIGHALKISFLGAPITIDDFYSFSELCFALGSMKTFFLILPFLLFVVLFLYNFKIYRVSSSISFAVMLIIPIVLLANQQKVIDSIESYYNFDDWNQWRNLNKSGGSVYLLYRGVRFLKDKPKAPDISIVKSALAKLIVQNPSVNTSVDSPNKLYPRNVYFILMESLWDPLLLKNISFSDDPWDHDFRKLWDRGGNSWALSCSYGGKTANAEFELLTGHPANLYGPKIMFESGIVNHIPALPAVFSQYGYETYVFHPNFPSFWNRLNIYQLFGFKTHFSINNFVLDDMNGRFLSDESLYRQAYQFIRSSGSVRPKFIYVLTFTGHQRYELNASKRPAVIRSDSTSKSIERYANVMRYTTKETFDFIKLIRREDSDALIVILGDHLPIFGPKFMGFFEAGLLEDSFSKFTAKMYRTYAATPLIIIDGENGPLDVGTIAMYEVPQIILKLLDLHSLRSISLFKPPDGLHIRTFPGMSLVLDDEGNILQLCKTDTENRICNKVYEWLENIKIIDADILFGKQFTLEEIKKLEKVPAK